MAIAIDASGSNLYIAENDFFQACRIRRVAGGVMSLFAGEGRCGGSPDGTPPLTARIHPLDIAVGSTGDVFIAGFCTVRRISGGILGTSATCDPAAPGSPPYRADLFPEVLTVRGSGDVWLADFQTCRVMHVGAASVPVVAGNGYCGFFGGDGAPAVYATLNSPRGVAVDDAGTVYIADTSNCRIRKVVGGVITTIAGNACGTGTLPLPAVGVAIPATYGAVLPVSIAATSAGDIYLLDENACRLRKVSGGAITTLAGGSICGWSISDGMAAAASQFPGVAGVAVASDETVYVSAACQIWSIALGVVHLVAGTGSCTSSGDGGAATSAGLNVPLGLAYHNGDLYIAERGACRIRLVRAGIITTVAGHPSGTLCGFGGDGGSATDGLLDQPTNVALDAAGTLYIGDKGNCRVRKVKAAKISTFAGNGICGFGGDGGLASMASLDSLAALRVLAVTADTFGEVYIADEGNDRIRAVRPAALCAAVMRADVNGDAKVNILDLSTIAHHYGELIPPAPARYDQNADGKINIFDLSIPAGVYGKTLAAACP
ncbi:MAG: hypothetical protein KGK07_13725 [Chloroflexota bacterium]|nr:hypothetical protein [Chloroflexota bacterium]